MILRRPINFSSFFVIKILLFLIHSSANLQLKDGCSTVPEGNSYQTLPPKVLTQQVENAQLQNSSFRKVRSKQYACVGEKSVSDLAEDFRDLDFSIIPGHQDGDEFENWSPPTKFRQDFPMYLTGFDRQNRPIWVLEWGKYRFDRYARITDKKLQALFEKYIRYLIYTALKSQSIKSTKELPVHQTIGIVDFEGLPIEFLTNRKILRYQLGLVSAYRRYFEKHVFKIIIINMNPVAEVLFNSARPLVLRLLNRMEVYGTLKSTWAPALVKHFHKDNLPEWYGGSKNFKPVCVIG